MSDYRTFAEFSENAQSGDAEALYQLGICYLEGKGVEQNYQMAAKMWLQSAKQKHAVAQMRLGMLFEEGLGVTQQYLKAIQCYQASSQLNLAEAKVRLAKMYYRGLGVEPDTQKAIALCIQAAEQGNADAQFYLATAYYRGIGKLSKNKNLAVFWYQQAATQQHEKAKQALAHIEKQQALQQAKKNDKQAESNQLTQKKAPTKEKEKLNIQFNTIGVLNSSASEQHIHATTDQSQFISVRVQSMYAQPHHQSKLVDETAVDKHQNLAKRQQQRVANVSLEISPEIKQFVKLAEQGDAKAQYNCALSLLFGIGGQIFNVEQAIDWLEKSAKQDFRQACVVLGWIYQGGLTTMYHAMGQLFVLPDDFQIDNELAIQYYQKAGALGHAQTQYFLANLYASGQGVSVDKELALTWLKQSAKQGYTKAYEKIEKNSV